MSETNSLLNKTWAKLSEAMVGMFKLQSMTADTLMELYNDIDNYFRSPERDEAFLKTSKEKLKTTKQSDKNNNEEDEKEDDTNIPGGELYFKLKNFLKEHLEKIAENGNNLEGEAFLGFYAKTWKDYQFLSQIVNRLFTSMNNNWLLCQRKIGVTNVYDVYTMAMQVWQDIFFKEANQSLTRTCLNLIRDERGGRHIESLLIRQVLQSYVSAGFTEDERNNKSNRPPTLATYKDYFEKQFLQETEEFYQLESNNYLENNSVNDYLKKVTQRLKEEEQRARDHLHATTLEKIKSILEKVLIENKLDHIYPESFRLLHAEKIEDLRVLFELVNRINKANEKIQNELQEYTYKIGMDAINSVKATATKDPKSYVEAIIEIYTRFFKIVKEGFCCEHGYTAALDKACSKFINDNAVTQEVKKSAKSPELLARYCDTLLRKGNKIGEDDVEEKISKIMVVFNYIEDKDVFQKFYGKMLAKRLVGQLSASDDYEESMISKLKAACGFEYASKLQRMFQDIRLSTSLIDEYKAYCQNMRLGSIVDFSVMVLTSNSWPFTAPPPFNLSFELQETFDSFTRFYLKKFTGRKLEWLYQHSKGELQTLYTKPKYTLQVSTYQMAVLLLFNKVDNKTVEALLDETQIETELLLQILLNLLISKVLKCSEISPDDLNENLKESDIKRNYTIQVDESFKSKKVKINLNQPIKSVEQKDTETVNQSIDEDRKMLTQAAIVRIMKARKELRHALLIQEVIPQLTPRFKPQIPMIKKCIDILIEKEYLERDSQERDLFRYLA